MNTVTAHFLPTMFHWTPSYTHLYEHVKISMRQIPGCGIGVWRYIRNIVILLLNCPLIILRINCLAPTSAFTSLVTSPLDQDGCGGPLWYHKCGVWETTHPVTDQPGPGGPAPPILLTCPEFLHVFEITGVLVISAISQLGAGLRTRAEGRDRVCNISKIKYDIMI